MTLERIRAYCMAFPGTTEEMQWGDHLLFKVRGKMYLIASPDVPGVPVTFKSTDGEFEELIESPGIIPAPYMARNKWVMLESAGVVPPGELQRLIARSYALVVQKLPKKARAELQASASSAARARARSKASLP